MRDNVAVVLPTIPRADADPAGRTAQLERARAELAYAYDRPTGVAMAREVPSRFGFPAGVVARVAAAEAELLANRAAARLREGLRGIDPAAPTTQASARQGTGASVVRTGRGRRQGTAALIGATPTPERSGGLPARVHLRAVHAGSLPFMRAALPFMRATLPFVRATRCIRSPRASHRHLTPLHASVPM